MMRRPQRSGSRFNALDRMIHRFQDRWETDRQYRAMMSGVLGLVMIVALCSCMGVVTTVANSALAGVSSARNSGGGSQNSNTGTGQINGVPTFPISTVPPMPQSATPPYSVIPNSKTPVPSPTLPPTATPQPTQPGGGGGDASCNGRKNGITWALTPCPQVHGHGGTITISSPNHPGTSLNILIGFGTCDSCAVDFSPAQGYKLDSSGNASISYTVPAGAANSAVPISGSISLGSGQSAPIVASPVQ